MTRVELNLTKGQLDTIASSSGFSSREAERLAIGTVEFIELIINGKPGTIVFLDKSARPPAELLRLAWRRIFPGERLPVIRHMNVPALYKLNGVDTSQAIQEVRKIYRNMVSPIIVVDEFMQSGRTARTAKYIIEEAIPDSQVTQLVGFLPTVPSWYSRPEKLGVVEDGTHMVARRDPANRQQFLRHRLQLRTLVDGFLPYVLVRAAKHRRR